MNKPPVLFHGTTRDIYDEALRVFGVYKFLVETVGLKYDYSTAFGSALMRGHVYNGLVLLVVDPEKATGFRRTPFYECEALDRDSYQIVDIKFDGSALSDETKTDIERAKTTLKNPGLRLVRKQGE